MKILENTGKHLIFVLNKNEIIKKIRILYKDNLTIPDFSWEYVTKYHMQLKHVKINFLIFSIFFALTEKDLLPVLGKNYYQYR